MKPALSKTKINIATAILIKLISIYKQLGYPLSELEIHKICYFLQLAGEDLKLNFSKNIYGPHAENLSSVFSDLKKYYLIENRNEQEETILLRDGALEEAKLFLEQSEAEYTNRINKIAKLIDGFETPYGMELLSTVHWIAVKNDTNYELSEVIEGVYNWQPDQPSWNSRKKAIMNKNHIAVALNRLKASGYLTFSL